MGRPGWWLWNFSTPFATFYRVEESRGADVVAETLGPEFAGTLGSDCLSSYDAIDCPKHKCLAHHLRVLVEHEESLKQRGIQSTYLFLWKLHLKDVIATWHDRSRFSLRDYVHKVLQLLRGVQNLLNRSPPYPEEVQFRDRLRKHQPHLLGCLKHPAIEPTNNRAERDLRPAVIDRKLSCANKTVAGKQAWEIVRSIVATLHKQGHDLLAALLPHLRLAPQ